MPYEASDFYQFPDKFVPDSQKDEDWHREYLLAIMSQTLGGGWFSVATSAMDENYNVFNSLDSGQEFDFLQESESGESLPAIWINYNKIRKKIFLMIGELHKKGINITVQAINKEAKTRKMEFKNKVLAQMRMKAVYDELSAETGIEIGAEEGLPETLEELETYIKARPKDNHEIVMEAALKYSMEMYKWEFKRLQAFRDMMITGRCFAKSEVRNGHPNVRIIDPRFVVFDPYSNDDFLTDASYMGEVRYMTFEDAAEQYGIKPGELHELYEKANAGYIRLYWQGAVSVGAGFQTFLPFTEINGGVRVLVFEAEWLDYKTVKYIENEDKNGNKHYKMADEKAKGKNVVEKVIVTVRKAAMVGGYHLKNWGELENQTRTLDNPSVTRLSYKALLPNYVNYRSISLVDELRGMQKLKDIIMYRIQLEVNTAGRKGLFYDLALLPKNLSYEKVMYYMKVSGVGFYDSRKEGVPMGGTPVHQYDNSLTNAIQNYITLAEYIDKEMNEVSGINQERSGYQTSGQLVGVTEAAIVQSALTTEPYYELFRQFEERTWEHQANLIKITWPNNREKYAPILGETGIDFLKVNLDVDLDDYAVFIQALPPALEDKNMIRELGMAAVQSGNLELRDLLILYSDPNPKLAIRKFLSLMDKRDAMREQELANQQQFLLQQQQIQQQGDIEKAIAEQQAIAQGNIATENVKAERQKIQTQMKMDQQTQEAENERNTKLLLETIKERKG